MQKTKKLLIDWGSSFDVIEIDDYNDLLGEMSDDVLSLMKDTLWSEVDRHEYITELDHWNVFSATIIDEGMKDAIVLRVQVLMALTNLLQKLWLEVEEDVRSQIKNNLEDWNTDSKIDEYREGL